MLVYCFLLNVLMIGAGRHVAQYGGVQGQWEVSISRSFKNIIDYHKA